MTVFTRIKRFIGRSLDMFGWFVLGRTDVRLHHWGTRDVTNKGDISIREVIKDDLRTLFAPRPVIFTELHWYELVPAAAAEIDKTHDMFVIGGGGYIFSDHEGNISPRNELDLAAIASISCPKIGFGLGWNKIVETGDLRESRPLSDKSRDVLRNLLQHLDAISVRDAATHALVTELIGREPVLAGDPALFYEGNKSKRKFADGKLHVGLNFALHGKERVELIAQQHGAFCEALAEFARRHDVVYHYVQHAYTERALPWMLRARGIPVVLENLPVDQMPALYGALDIHLCQMLHSAILAVDAGTPTLHFGYDVKCIGFFDLMQMPELCFPDRPLNSELVLAELESLLANSQRIRSHIAHRKDEIKQVSDGFLEDIKVLLEKRLA